MSKNKKINRMTKEELKKQLGKTEEKQGLNSRYAKDLQNRLKQLRGE